MINRKPTLFLFHLIQEIYLARILRIATVESGLYGLKRWFLAASGKIWYVLTVYCLLFDFHSSFVLIKVNGFL